MKLVSRYNAIAILFIFMASLANCASALAVDYTKIGVKVGNTAEYKTSTDHGPYNRTHILVYGIILSGIVYLNFTHYNPDGTVASEYQIICDLVIGGVPSFAFLLAANLTAGDPVYSGTPMKINETTTMTFAGTLRTVNHLRLPDGTFEAYWDKATGLVCKLNWWYIGWLNMTIISTDAWSIVTPPPPPPPPVTPPLSVKLSGEFDYGNKEKTNIRLAALVKNSSTSKPVSGANVIIQIYYPNGTLWVSGIMLEKLVGTGIYEWESSSKIDKMKPNEGVYLVHVKAFVSSDPTASDMLLFHIDPPSESEDPSLTTVSPYVASAIVLIAGTIVGTFLIRRHKKPQAETAHTIKLPTK